MGRTKVMPKQNWILFCRCFLVLLGLLFSSSSIRFAAVSHGRGDLLTPGPFLMFIAFLAGGAAIAVFAMRGSPNSIDRFADGAARHWAGALLMLPAYPLYYLMKALQKDQKGDGKR